MGDGATYDLFGPYVQNELPLGERCELVTGLRDTYVSLRADKVNFPGAGLGSLSGHWDADRHGRRTPSRGH